MDKLTKKDKNTEENHTLIRFIEETKEGKYGFVFSCDAEKKDVNKRINAERILISNTEEEYVYSVC